MHSPLRQPNSFTQVGETNMGKNKFIMRAHMRNEILQNCWIQFCYVWKAFRFFYDFFIYHRPSKITIIMDVSCGCKTSGEHLTHFARPKYISEQKKKCWQIATYMNTSAAPCLSASKRMDYH